MHNQNQNPAYIRFKNTLPSSGRYPAKHVDIFWNVDSRTHKIKEVEVVFIPRDKLSDEIFQAEYSAYNKKWKSDLGNSTLNWLEDGGYTPEDIFGHLLNSGFASASDLELALEEFSNIEECAWARRMLRGFRDK